MKNSSRLPLLALAAACAMAARWMLREVRSHVGRAQARLDEMAAASEENKVRLRRINRLLPKAAAPIPVPRDRTGSPVLDGYARGYADGLGRQPAANVRHINGGR